MHCVYYYVCILCYIHTYTSPPLIIQAGIAQYIHTYDAGLGDCECCYHHHRAAFRVGSNKVK